LIVMQQAADRADQRNLEDAARLQRTLRDLDFPAAISMR